MAREIADTPPLALELEYLPPRDLRAHPGNARHHPPEQVAAIAASIREVGFTAPVLVDAERVIVAGHGRVQAAIQAGLATIPTINLAHLTAEQARAYRVADNRLAEMSAWDDAQLAAELSGMGLDAGDMGGLGFTGVEFDGITDPLPPPVAPPPAAKPSGKGGADAIEQAVTAAPQIVKPGDVWRLGRHRLACGNCTDRATIKRTLGGATPDLILVDPPYCSGGWQEAGKARGSVGVSTTEADNYRPVRGDNLNSRGYQSLLAATFKHLARVDYAYIFTDWRMWSTLEEVVGLQGMAMRQMIVWNKTRPGMGRQWRAQHELIAWAVRRSPVTDPHHTAVGNVIDCARQGNHHHTTEKPTDVLCALINNTPFAESVIDPMAGSGSTLIAAEMCERQCFAVEFDPEYCNVAIERWRQLTGGTPKRLFKGAE